MIYLGKYYNNYGVDASINIPRYEYLGDIHYDYDLILTNNVTNASTHYLTEDGLTQNSTNPYYYNFSNIDTSTLTDGEYTLILIQQGDEVYRGLLTYRDNDPSEKKVYNKTTEYVVYK